MGTKYAQHDGYDKYRNEDDDGNTENRGKAEYDSNGVLTRLDNYSPSATDPDKHHHEWLYRKDDGTYEYGHGTHDNH